jgi:large subunit ribosomal protein L17
MAKYRKLGRTSDQRKALMRNQITALLANGKIVTTEARAKEIRGEVEKLITIAAKEKDNFDTVTVTAKVAKKDAEGKRVKEVVDGKKVTVYETVEKTIKKDQASRLHARRQILSVLYPVVDSTVTTDDGKKKTSNKRKDKKEVDLVAKLFDEYAPKYADRKGGYTRITRIGMRKGDAAMMVLLELV